MPPVDNQSTDKPINIKIGIIYPPPEVRNIVDKTASFVARNGPDFESRIRQNEISNPKFNFLNPADPYHAYYQHKVSDFAEGKAVETASMQTNAPSSARLGQDAQKIMQDVFVPKEAPPEFEYLQDPASINALDIDIVKLTAQFVARNGKQFLAQLMNREQRNCQFDFLRTQHSMFGYFTKLVEQYTKVLIPPRDITNSLEDELSNPKSVLDQVKYRVEWYKHQERQRKREEEAVERERVAYAQIDWHDFVVVETVDFPINETGSFPMPTCPEEVGARTIADERGDPLIQNGLHPPGIFDPLPTDLDQFEDEEEDLDDDEGFEETTNDDFDKPVDTDFNEIVDTNIDKTKAENEDTVTQNVISETIEISDFNKNEQLIEDDMELSDEEDVQIPADKPEVKHMPTSHRPLPPNVDQVLIRHDYDPKVAVQQQKDDNQVLLISPFTGEKIPASQAPKHIRVGLLDPKWIAQRNREVREKREQDQVYASGGLIENNLKRFAQRRSDIFGAGSEETQIGKTLGDDDQDQNKSDKVIWDGHAISADTINKRARDYITPADVQAQYDAEQKLEAEREKIGIQLPTAPLNSIMLPVVTLSNTSMLPPVPPPNLMMMMANAPPGMLLSSAPPLPPSMFPPSMPMPPSHPFMAPPPPPPPPEAPVISTQSSIISPPGIPLPQTSSAEPENKRLRTDDE